MNVAPSVVRLVQNVTLKNGLRRVELQQVGRMPTCDDVPAGILPADNRPLTVIGFERGGVWHLVVCWKLKPVQVEGLGGQVKEVWS